MSLLASGDSSVHLFEGEPDHLMSIHCVESLDSMLFCYAGLMISHSFLHDGYPLIGVSKAAAAYIITASVDEAIPYLSSRDIPDCEIREILQHLNKREYFGMGSNKIRINNNELYCPVATVHLFQWWI